MVLLEKIAKRQAKLAVIGLGYVGLPLAVEFARAGLKVAGVDIDGQKLLMLQAGESYIKDVSSGSVAEIINSERFIPTSNPKYLNLSDIIAICVPTPCSHGNEPDLSFIEAAAKMAASQLKPGHLVILESTSFPGTTEEILQPILETSGLKAGRDFFLAFSPERIDPGNAEFTLRNTPKIVAGTTPEATALAEAFYSVVAEEVHTVSSPRTAEMTKLYENTFRHINIGFANEMAMLCEKMGINIWEVIQAASTKPFGFMPFYPGPGVGGHCIPVDPQYLLFKARQHNFNLRFVELANDVNEHMPEKIVDKVAYALDEQGKPLKGSNLLVLGVAYKKDIDDVRESPAIRVIENLVARGARVHYHDPHVYSFENGCGRFDSVDLTDDELKQSDCVLICTDHSDLPYEKLEGCALVVDTRNALQRTGNGHEQHKRETLERLLEAALHDAERRYGASA
ncbi:MAG: nucleotide sugar dehydrogenase [Armatimonadetes bacterium]|nr:nucleotide sugar dehydrogenase [Armatimonadota bacterium]